jgi:hypothetical protein
METGRNAQYGAATGIVAVLLILVGFGIFSADIPELDASATEWQTFFVDHQDRIQTGLTIAGVGLFFYIWFLGSLRDAIAGAEGGTGRLASIAYGGGLISVASLVVTISGAAAAAFHPQGVDPTVTRALNDIGAVSALPAAAGLTALFAATAVAGYRHGALPAPVAGLAALAAVTQPLGFGAAVTDSGAFAPDGELALWVPLLTFVIAVLAISGTLASRAGKGAPAT